MRRQNTDAHNIKTQPILELCEELVRQKGKRFTKWWWEQEGLDLDGAWAGVEATTVG